MFPYAAYCQNNLEHNKLNLYCYFYLSITKQCLQCQLNVHNYSYITLFLLKGEDYLIFQNVCPIILTFLQSIKYVQPIILLSKKWMAFSLSFNFFINNFLLITHREAKINDCLYKKRTLIFWPHKKTTSMFWYCKCSDFFRVFRGGGGCCIVK